MWVLPKPLPLETFLRRSTPYSPMILTIIVNESPYGSEKPWNALRLASTALGMEPPTEVRVFLMGDAVAAAKSGQKTPEGYYNLEKMLSSILRRGAQVLVCGTCIDSRGISQDQLVEGVERGTMKALATWIAESQRVVSF